MNLSQLMTRALATTLVLAALAVPQTGRAAESLPGKATVRGILGHAQFSRAGEPFLALGPGMDLRQGDLIQTASKSAIELDFGKRVGTIRLTEGAVLVLEKIAMGDSNSGTGVEIQIDLRTGEVVGDIEPLPAGAHVEVKTPVGLAQVIEGQFRVNDQGYVVVVEGRTLFAYVPATGEPTANTLSGPPASYFSPAEGVREAPKQLAREVTKQLRARLPRR
jgi:hypothetical protein